MNDENKDPGCFAMILLLAAILAVMFGVASIFSENNKKTDAKIQNLQDQITQLEAKVLPKSP